MVAKSVVTESLDRLLERFDPEEFSFDERHDVAVLAEYITDHLEEVGWLNVTDAAPVIDSEG
ncbi:hypothetical protein pEaSNUABM54_00092 [Erwinia phage pEa_SNUABM_54]|nr:hypothetical protein pEaSNUABM54_00092 [Erwinia phage pEa_SNUABM_54]